MSPGVMPRVSLVALLLLGPVSSRGQSQPPPSVPAQVDGLLTEAGQDLYREDDEALASIEAKLLSVDFQGLRLRAPVRVDLNRESLPLLYARRTTGQRDWEVAPQRNAHLLAVDLERGDIYLGWAFQPLKRYRPESLPRSRQEPAPSKTEQASITAQLGRLDARALTGMPWRSGRYALTLISWDQVSNTVIVELAEDALTPSKPMPLSQEEARQRLQGWRQAGAVVDKGLATLQAPGVKLSLPTRLRPGGKVVARGALRMRVPESLALSGSSVLPFGVLLLRKDETAPPVVRAAVPLPQTPTVTPDGTATVHFSLGLAEAVGQAPPPGEFQSYLIAGPYSDGPRHLEFTR